MIDVNKITSTLAKLPDAQLQQYAQMHKNDPYIMALAMSESNRRKELRDAGQAAQGMQEQPKVVDRMVAEMAPQPAPQQLPEEMGIARIPAGDMNFAGGGIVAFADGGDVERYQAGGLFETDPAKLRALAEERLRLEQLRQGRLLAGGPYSSLSPATPQTSSSIFRSLNPTGVAAYGLGLYHGDLNEGEAAELERRRAKGPTIDSGLRATTTPSPTDPNFRRQEDPRMKSGVAATAQPLITSGAAPKPDATRKDKGSKVTAAETEPSTKPDTGGLDSLIKDFTRQTDLAQGALKNQRAGLAAQLEQEAKGIQEEGEKRRKERGDVFAGREARLAEREKGVGEMKDKNFGLALLQAGAAMMSTPGNLGTAIGKGVQVGSERYVAGLDKINAAKDKFAEARDRLDELRLNRDDMNEKEIKEEQRAIRNARLQGQQLLVDGATNDLKISNDNQKAIFGVAAESLLTDKRLKSAENIAHMQERRADARAALPTPEMREAMLLGTGNTPEEKYLTGLQVKRDLLGDKQGMKMLQLFLEENGRREKAGQNPLTLEQFRRTSAAFFAPPTPVDTSKPTRP